ncbi:hypothetical protein [Tsukamurella sp. PLM1]|uniref:hypothetical protein n=1 Tax=Tsukamurella sp. PLM1 TaxID=2929795 RepID=UPI0020BF2D66|nr:hypothetical protein [Tsukamurella sp. PLM1]
MTSYAPPIAPHRPAASGARTRSTASWVLDIIAGCTFWAVLSLLGMCAVYFSFFFAMAADGCYSATRCPHEELIGTGMVTVWGGVAAALLIALVGSLVSLVRRRCFWYWPLLGIPIVVVATWIGTELANRGGGLS